MKTTDKELQTEIVENIQLSIEQGTGVRMTIHQKPQTEIDEAFVSIAEKRGEFVTMIPFDKRDLYIGRPKTNQLTIVWAIMAKQK